MEWPAISVGGGSNSNTSCQRVPHSPVGSATIVGTCWHHVCRASEGGPLPNLGIRMLYVLEMAAAAAAPKWGLNGPTEARRAVGPSSMMAEAIHLPSPLPRAAMAKEEMSTAAAPLLLSGRLNFLSKESEADDDF